jgi:hypothetical protein
MANKGTDQAVTRREHDLTAEAKRVVGTDPFGGLVTEGNFSERTYIEEVGSVTTIYQGFAQIGSASSDALWQISKTVVDETSGTLISKTWANATDAFTNVWDDYSTYTYS